MQTWIFLTKVDMKEFFIKSHIKEGNLKLITLKDSKNAQAWSVSVGIFYSEDQLMHTFLDNFHQGGKYSAQMASHQVELRREAKLLVNILYLSHP